VNDNDVILEVEDVQKRFGRVEALRDADFELRNGEVHAIVGDNGAGKSTLIKIISGVYQADAGELRLDGKPIAVHNPREARELWPSGLAITPAPRELLSHLCPSCAQRATFIAW